MTEKKTTEDLSRRKLLAASSSLATIAALGAMAPVQTAQAQGMPQPSSSAGGEKPNIILILSDDFGYGDSGVYGGGENRGMPTPSIDRLRPKACNSCRSMRSRVARPDVPRCRPAEFQIAAA